MLTNMWWVRIVVMLVVLMVSSCDEQQSISIKTESMEDKTSQLDRPLSIEDRKRVLVLHSYHPEYAWLKEVNKGILNGLAEERFSPEKNIVIEYLYMDTKRKTSPEWKNKIAEEAIEKIRSWQPHVVIATDDNAQQYVVAKMKDSDTNFVFLGVNADPMKYGYIESHERPGGSITGSIERARFGQTVKLLQRLKPEARRIAIISDDSATGKSVVNRVLAKAEVLGIEVVTTRLISDFQEWKDYVRSVQDKADALLVIVYHTVKDESGETVPSDKVLSWTIANSRLPDIGFWSWAVDGGLLCSEAISGYQQGHYAATVASYVLMGQSPGDFAVGKPQRGELCINLARAKMLGIEVPADMQRIATVFNTIASDKGM